MYYNYFVVWSGTQMGKKNKENKNKSNIILKYYIEKKNSSLYTRLIIEKTLVWLCVSFWMKIIK